MIRAKERRFTASDINMDKLEVSKQRTLTQGDTVTTVYKVTDGKHRVSAHYRPDLDADHRWMLAGHIDPDIPHRQFSMSTDDDAASQLIDRIAAAAKRLG